jgi:hypothetical protein
MGRVAVTLIAIVMSGMALRSQTPAGGEIAQIRNLGALEGIELSGSYNSASFTEGGGPGGANDRRTFDFLGIPMNEAAKAWALSHDESQLSEPERQCAFYTPVYYPYGFAPLNIWREDELRTGSTTAWVLGGFQDTKPMVIWMDGRPHPPKNAPHRIEGFTTGVWENDVLVTTTTHMTQGRIHRRAPQSDQATLTLRFSRHGDIMTLTGRVDDPVYLTEPLYVSKEWTLTSNQANRASTPCTVAFEGVPSGKVPHYLPGQNPNVEEMTTLWGIPVEAVKGGPETMYPEYRKKLKDTYKRPAKRPFGATRTGIV